jgi:type IV pilus assembly protein PilE
MNSLQKKWNSGITLIELMIVLVIVAVLLALAYPSYVEYVRKAKRGEAQQLLLNWAVNQEIFRSNNPQYAGTVDLPVPTHDYFTFTLADRSATTYTLRAQATGDQAKDKSREGEYCGGSGQLMTLDQNGQKSPPSCWE